jgi:dTDP-4-amino-4,6-dideoxygalactose transaminase
MAVPLMDIRGQYEQLLPEIKSLVCDVIESGRFILGPNVRALEEEVAATIGYGQAIAVANGTDALELGLQALGIGPGDEVVTSAYTFYATAEAIARRGATPVFADVDAVTLNLDPADVERKITERTKAIMPVHLFGRPAADFKGFGLPVIEDAAQAFGAGGIATSIASTYSFFPTKNLFALGDGGLIGVNDAELAERLRMLRFHGSQSKKEFLYVGYNSRLDAMQAAFLRIFLRHIDDWNRQRREAAARYRELLDGVVELPIDEPEHIYHQFCVRSPERDRIAAALSEADIATAIYYQPPLHLQPALRYLGYSEGDLPETEKASRENLCLPMWAGISEEQQLEVVSVVKRASELVRS